VLTLLAYFKTVFLLSLIFIILLYVILYKMYLSVSISFFAQISAMFMISSGRIALRISIICDKITSFIDRRPNSCVCVCVMVQKSKQ